MTMPLEEFLSQPVTNIDAFDSLVIDSEIWREAHGHHAHHRAIHALTAHRPGIVYGLEVSVGQSHQLYVSPGVAVDALGNVIIVSEALALNLNEQDGKGDVFLVLQYEEVPDPKSEVTVSNARRPFRKVEGRQLYKLKQLPAGSCVELARIDRSSAKAGVKSASNPFDPAEDELNTLHRNLSFPHCHVDGGLGEFVLVPKKDFNKWKLNRPGLFNLIRESQPYGFALRFLGPYSPQEPGSGEKPLMLYTGGDGEFLAPSDAEVQGLRTYLDSGGFLFAEACRGGSKFEEGFLPVAAQLGANLQPVGAGHLLLASHLMFPSVPPGGRESGQLLADLAAGVVYSSYDYAGAWMGVVDGKSPERERVRASVELGLNLVMCAHQRARAARLGTL